MRFAVSTLARRLDLRDPVVIAVIVAVCFTLYRSFKRAGWL